jgi:hypothetical protein
MRNAKKFEYLGEFEDKIENTLGVNKELRWVLLAKPV